MVDEHVALNRDYWNGMAEDWIAAGENAWAAEAPYWGIWELPEHDLRLLPADMAGLETVELGCGTGYVSGWMARRGARATGIDISREQLATARRLAGRHGQDITFLEGNAEATGLPGGAFDFAISEYGAAIWCDPYVWLPEAHRLLRPGGQLVFLGHHPFVYLSTPHDALTCDRGLHRPYRGLHREDWSQDATDPGGVEFNLTFAGWMRLFADTGFEVTNYQELYAPDSAEGAIFDIPADWARDFPAEQVWHLRKSS
jgi:SAM-dependent methyltransferase